MLSNKIKNYFLDKTDYSDVSLDEFKSYSLYLKALKPGDEGTIVCNTT